MLDILFDHPFAATPEILRIRLQGRLDANGAADFDERLASAPSEAQTVILDMSELEYLSSAGIRSLLQLHKDLTARSASMLLMGLTPFVRQVVELSGLTRTFNVVDGIDDARQRCFQAVTAPWQEELALESGSAQLSFTPWCNAYSAVETWQGDEQQPVVQVSLAELGLCMGAGGFGTRPEQAQENLGAFFTGLHVAALLPEDKDQRTDYITTRYPMETVMFVASGAAINGEPACCMRLESDEPVPLGQALQSLDGGLRTAGLHQAAGNEARGLRAVFIQMEDLQIAKNTDTTALGAVGFCYYLAEGAVSKLPPVLQKLPWRNESGLEFCCLALTLNRPPVGGCDALPLEILEQSCDVQSIERFCELTAQSAFKAAAFWSFTPSVIRSSEEKRLQIDYALASNIPGQANGNGAPSAAGHAVAGSDPDQLDAWDAIIRNIYVSSPHPMGGGRPVARKVELQPLRGGADATSFLVESQDGRGRRMQPTVLKLGTAKRIKHEQKAWAELVKPNLPQNATALTEIATHGKYAGVAYTFTGNDADDMQLSSLAQFYAGRAVSEIIPLMDQLVTQVLKPWYAQPTWGALHLWREHDPTRLFPDIVDKAQTTLGLSPESKYFDCPELGRQLRNPFHVLAQEFPKRAQETTPWYSCIVHGDLNMQNVLLDEQNALYVVDFSETRRGNAVADFARLEPVLLLEHSRLANEEDMDTLARFIETWYAGESYAATPPFGYAGSDPRISKTYQILRRLRGYANTVTLFERDLYPYLLAVLQWTLPTVCFNDFKAERKRLGAIMAGILCERILGEE